MKYLIRKKNPKVIHILDEKVNNNSLCTSTKIKKYNIVETKPEDIRLCIPCSNMCKEPVEEKEKTNIWLIKEKLMWLSKPIVGQNYVELPHNPAAPWD